MKPELVVIEDYPRAYDELLPAIQRNLRYQELLEVNLELSKPIVSGYDVGNLLRSDISDMETFRRNRITYAEFLYWISGSTVPKNMILTVDLNLQLGSYGDDLWRQLNLKFKTTEAFTGHESELIEDLNIDRGLLDGLFLALEAIDNPKIEHLLIFIASTMGGIGLIFELLENALRKNKSKHRKVARGKSFSWTMLNSSDFAVDYLLVEWNMFVSVPDASSQQLIEDFLKINFVHRSSHPYGPDEISNGIVGYSYFIKKDFDKVSQQYKALFHLEPSILHSLEGPDSLDGRRQFRVDEFVVYMAFFGVTIEQQVSDREMRFPISPGVLFVANFVAFCKTIQAHRIVITVEEDSTVLSLLIRDTQQFEMDLIFSTKEAATRFKQMVTCSKEILKESPLYYQLLKSHGHVIHALGMPDKVDHTGEKRPSILVQWEFDHTKSELKLFWT